MNTGVGCRALLQGIFVAQSLNLRLLTFPALEGNGSLLQYSCLENPMDRSLEGLWSMGLQQESKPPSVPPGKSSSHHTD